MDLERGGRAPAAARAAACSRAQQNILTCVETTRRCRARPDRIAASMSARAPRCASPMAGAAVHSGAVPVPARPFARAVDLAAPFNRLLAAVAATCRGYARRWPTRRRRTRTCATCSPSRAPRRVLSVNHSDYMARAEGGAAALRQIELNTVSCAFPALASRVATLHGFGNPACERVAAALRAAHASFPDAAERVVVVVVCAGERNGVDQRLLLAQLGDVAVAWRTLQQLHGDLDPTPTTAVRDARRRRPAPSRLRRLLSRLLRRGGPRDRRAGARAHGRATRCSVRARARSWSARARPAGARRAGRRRALVGQVGRGATARVLVPMWTRAPR